MGSRSSKYWDYLLNQFQDKSKIPALYPKSGYAYLRANGNILFVQKFNVNTMKVKGFVLAKYDLTDIDGDQRWHFRYVETQLETTTFLVAEISPLAVLHFLRLFKQTATLMNIGVSVYDMEKALYFRDWLIQKFEK
jgi:hypothetical protein